MTNIDELEELVARSSGVAFVQVHLLETLLTELRTLRQEKAEAVEALRDARMQLEYLDGKFTPTGTTAAIIARIDAALPPSAGR